MLSNEEIELTLILLACHRDQLIINGMNNDELEQRYTDLVELLQSALD